MYALLRRSVLTGKEAINTVRWGGASRGKTLRADIRAFRAEGAQLGVEAAVGGVARRPWCEGCSDVGRDAGGSYQRHQCLCGF